MEMTFWRPPAKPGANPGSEEPARTRPRQGSASAFSCDCARGARAAWRCSPAPGLLSWPRGVVQNDPPRRQPRQVQAERSPPRRRPAPRQPLPCCPQALRTAQCAAAAPASPRGPGPRGIAGPRVTSCPSPVLQHGSRYCTHAPGCVAPWSPTCPSPPGTDHGTAARSALGPWSHPWSRGISCPSSV